VNLGLLVMKKTAPSGRLLTFFLLSPAFPFVRRHPLKKEEI
jgi:hypothetical protein